MFAAPSEVYGIGKGTSTNQHCGNPCSGHKNLLEIYTLPASVPNPIAIAHKLFWYSPIRIEPALIFSSQSAILFIPSSIKHYPFSRHPSICFRRVCSGLRQRLGSYLAPLPVRPSSRLFSKSRGRVRFLQIVRICGPFPPSVVLF